MKNILKYKNSDVDVEFPLSSIFYNKCIDSVHDKEFLRELMKSKVSRRIIYAFTNFLEEQAVSVVEYADIIIALCENVLQMEENKLKDQWGIENEISKFYKGDSENRQQAVDDLENICSVPNYGRKKGSGN